VYIDLFAGAGKVKIEGTDKILLGSPLLALNVPDQFDRYIFCEQNPVRLGALKSRVRQGYPNADVHFLGDSNENVERILGLIPTPSKEKKVLTFCFVDPYSYCKTVQEATEMENPRLLDSVRSVIHYLAILIFVYPPTMHNEIK
jgi:three-Cys-motif partner protein